MSWARPSAAVVLRVLLLALAFAMVSYAAFYTNLPTQTPPVIALGATSVVLALALTGAVVCGLDAAARAASGAALLYVLAHLVSVTATSPFGPELTVATMASNAAELIVAALAWLLSAARSAPQEAAGAT